MELKWQRELDQMELEATMNASQYAQLLLYYALERKFGFSTKRISAVQEEINKITQEMLDGQYDLEWIENHFEEKDIVLEV